MHKGREQFWSLLLIAINIIVVSVITLAMMEIGEDAPTDIGNLLRCSSGGKTGTLRWWFQNLDRYQYIVGNADKYLICEFTEIEIFIVGIL